MSTPWNVCLWGSNMRDINFCDACEVQKKDKCKENRCANILFKDFETFFKQNSSDKSKCNCDLLFEDGESVAFVELKSTDRYTHDDGSLYSLKEVENILKCKDKKEKKKFDGKNYIKKFTDSMEFYFLKYPQCRARKVKYFFFFSTAFIDYFNEKAGVKIEPESVKLLLMQTLFALYPHNPVFHNGKIIPLKVGSCLEADVVFK